MGSKKKTRMDGPAKARIMSAAGKKTGGYYEKGSWPVRAQRAADRNANKRNYAKGVNVITCTGSKDSALPFALCLGAAVVFAVGTIYIKLKRFK